MEPLPPIKTSFVPRRPVGESSAASRPREANILLSVAVLTLLGSLGAWGGYWWHSRALDGVIVERNAELVEAQKKFDASEIPSVVDDFILLSDKMKHARNLINQHTNLVPLLALLSDLTLRDSVRYKSLMYESGSDTDVASHAIQLAGEAESFTSLAYQDDVLRKEESNGKSIASHSISNMRVDRETGRVLFTLAVVLNSSAVNYSATVPTP